MTILPTRTFNDDFLNPFRQRGDSAADAVIESVAKSQGHEGLGKLMQYLGDMDNLDYTQQPIEIQEFLKKNQDLPTFADVAKMKQAVIFFKKYEQLIPLILACYSLPYCYAAADGAQVLWLSQRIKNDTLKRLEETGQFVFEIMQERDWNNGRNAIKILKIRLMHAAVRYFTQQYPQWNRAWGLPINQEDMAGTNLAFSYIVIKGLRKLGTVAHASDEEAFLHFWNVVGFLLGVEEALLPQNLREAFHIDQRIAQRQFKTSEAGRGLTQALIHVFRQQWKEDSILQNLIIAQMRLFLSHPVADLLAIPKPSLEQEVVKWGNKTSIFKLFFLTLSRRLSAY
ncbi:MAG: oxygenase MpaB family protein [Spirosomataceae bacterium]